MAERPAAGAARVGIDRRQRGLCAGAEREAVDAGLLAWRTSASAPRAMPFGPVSARFRGVGSVRAVRTCGPDQPALGGWILFWLTIGIVRWPRGAAPPVGAFDSVNAPPSSGSAGLAAPGLPTEGGPPSARTYLPSYRCWIFLLVPTLGASSRAGSFTTWAPEAEGHGTDAHDSCL